MSSVQLCMFCDNPLKPGFKQCHVCDAEVAESLDGLSLNTKARVADDRNIGPQLKQVNEGDNKTEGNLRGTVLKVAEGIEPISPETTSEVSGPSASDVAGWTCSYCTLVNKSSLLTCVACFQPRNITQQGTEDAKEEETVIWSCKSCKCDVKSESELCDACLRLQEVAKNRVFTKPIYPVLDKEDGGNNVAADCSTSWKCIKCEYSNTMLALKCFKCENHNQIYRICKQCTTYFIMNDNDNQCGNCLIKAAAQRKVSLFEKVSSKVKNKNKWICDKDGCNTRNKNKSQLCKKCGVVKGDVSPSQHGKSSHGLKKNKRILNVFKGKEKPWYCDDSSCRVANPSSIDKCHSCGRNRTSSIAVFHSESTSIVPVTNSVNSNDSNICKSSTV